MVSEFVVDVVNAVSCCFAVLAEDLGKRVAWFAAIAFLGRCDVSVLRHSVQCLRRMTLPRIALKP